MTGVATGVGAGTCLNTPGVCNGDLASIPATVSITTGTSALSATTGVFSSGMAGRGIVVPGAGSNGGDLNTTIATFVDSQHVTTTINSGTSLSGVSVTLTVGTSVAQALADFTTWSVSTWQASHTGTIGLYIPPGSACQANMTINPLVFDGIRKMIVTGYGASLVVFGPSPMFLGNTGLNNQSGVASHCGLINTVASGATQVTTTTAGNAALMTAGQYAIVLGLDMQGSFNSDFGYPPNPAFFDYVLVSSVNAGTGVVQFSTTPITSDYKSTWPKIGTDPGPASICPMPDHWNIDYEYRGLTFTQGAGDIGSKSDGYRVTFRDMTFTGANGPTGSQNHEINFLTMTCASCTTEADKLVDLMNIQGGAYNVLFYQSSSIKRVVANGVTANQLKGGGKSFSGNNLTIPTLVIAGVPSYGRSTDFTCTNCVLGTSGDTSSFSAGGVSDQGLTNRGVSNVYQMSGGVIKVPNGRNITAISSGTAGVFRLTLACALVSGCTTPTAPYVENQWVSIANSSGGGGSDGERQIHIVDANNVELLGTTWNGATASGGYMWVNNPLRWAIPATNLIWSGGAGTAFTFKISDVTQDGDFINIATNWSGGFPTTGGAVVSTISVYPIPAWTCTTCTGHLYVSDMNQGTPGAPIFSYSKRRYYGSDMTTHSPVAGGIQTAWGSMISTTFNVVTPYTLSGVPGALTVTPTDRNVLYTSGMTSFRWAPVINMKNPGGTPHTVVVAPSGVTGNQTGDASLCDGVSPACTVTWASGEWYQGSGFNGFNPSSLIGNSECPTQGTSGCPVVDVEYKGNVGLPYLLRRDLDRSLPTNDNRPLGIDIAA